MQKYIPRFLTQKISRKLQQNPAVAVIGPRQCGKTTLAKAIISNFEPSVYLDLEKTSDLNKLQDPEAFLTFNADKLICLDEIHRLPDVFPLLRALIDADRRSGRFLLLGSASPALLKQSSESLAGRISYVELTPFVFTEIDDGEGQSTLRHLWLRGGYPLSYLAGEDFESLEWRNDLKRTLLERDIPQLGLNLPAARLDRLLRMCAHLQGQLLNSSKLSESLGISYHTVRSYIDTFEQTFLMRVLEPFSANIKKRLVKSPKIYIRDTGLLHALLDIETQNDLLGHPVYGPSWETFVIENILAVCPDWRASFYRTSAGAEIDLVLEKGSARIAVECKASTAPKLNRGFWNALDDLHIQKAWVAAPVKESYPIKNNIKVAPLRVILDLFLSL